MKQIAYLVGAVFLAALAIFAYKGCKKNEFRKQATQVASVQYDSVKHWHDLWNTEHATKELIQGEKKVLDLFYKHRIDSLAKRLHLRDKQIQDMTEVLMRAEGSYTTDVEYITVHDTIPGLAPDWSGMNFEWHDKYLKTTGFVDSSKAVVFYSIDVPVHITTYWKRKWFLGKKRYYIDGFSPNPNVKILGLTGIKIN